MGIYFVIDKDAFRDVVLKGDATADMIRQACEDIRARCGEGYATKVEEGKTRYLGAVYAESREAKLDNSENNTILKALY